MERSYSELMQFDSYEDRFKYLLCHDVIGDRTFGGYRYLGQAFYSSDI